MKSFLKTHRTLSIVLIVILAAAITAAAVLLAMYIKNRVAWEKQFRVDKEAKAHGGAVRAVVATGGGNAVTERPEDIETLLSCIKLVRENRITASGKVQGTKIQPIDLVFADGTEKHYDVTMALDGKPADPFEEFFKIPYIAEQLKGD